MRDNSFVYLWRSIMDTSFYRNPLTCHLAVHLILSAAWRDHRLMLGGKEFTIRRGQIPTGRAKLADETGLSPQNVRTCLSHLEKCGFLTIESTNQCSIITICKYDEYQACQPEHQPANQPAINQRSTSDQPLQNKDNKVINNKNLSASADAVGEDGVDFLITKKKRVLNGKRWEAFQRFWDAFAYKKGLREAADAWMDIPKLTNQLVEKIIAGAEVAAKERPAMLASGKSPKMAQGWISAMRWEDEQLIVPDEPTTCGLRKVTIADMEAANAAR